MCLYVVNKCNVKCKMRKIKMHVVIILSYVIPFCNHNILLSYSVPGIPGFYHHLLLHTGAFASNLYGIPTAIGFPPLRSW
jgi:hypothetical protein